MCQDDLGPTSVLSPFEEDAISELISAHGERNASVRYAARVARLAIVLHDVVEAIKARRDELPLQIVREADQAELILEQESAASRSGAEVV